MSFKSVIGKAVIGAAMFAATTMAAQAEDVTLKLATTLLEKQPAYPYVTQMIEEIEGAGVGIKVQFFPAGQLGSGEELLEDAKFGNVDMVHAAIYAQADPRLEFTDLPFLITSLDDIQTVIGDPNSEYNTILAEIFVDHGLKYLATVGEGLIGVVAAKQPANPQGIGNQEMNIRVWSSNMVKSTMELLGYNTTTMNWAEVFPAVQAGTIDGAICCTSELAYTLFAESDVGNTFIPYNAFIERNVIYMSGAKWARLSPEQQEVVQKAALKAATGINNNSWNLNETYIAKLKEKGWTVVDFTPEQRAMIKEKIVAEIWPTVGDLVGEEILNRITKE